MSKYLKCRLYILYYLTKKLSALKILGRINGDKSIYLIVFVIIIILTCNFYRETFSRQFLLLHYKIIQLTLQ